jgi:hypothetical protein
MSKEGVLSGRVYSKENDDVMGEIHGIRESGENADGIEGEERRYDLTGLKEERKKADQ